MSCGVGCRCSSDPVLLWLWLWHRPATTAPIQTLIWDPPYAMALDKKKKKKISSSGIVEAKAIVKPLFCKLGHSISQKKS